MIRIIIRTDDASMAANVGGTVLTLYKTIDVDLPEVERLLVSAGSSRQSFQHAQVVGVEVLP